MQSLAGANMKLNQRLAAFGAAFVLLSGTALGQVPRQIRAPSQSAAGTATPGETSASKSGQHATSSQAERDAFWNSDEMVEARAWLVERGRISRQFGPKQTEEYIAALSKKSLSEMKDWHARFEVWRAGMTRSAEAGRVARQKSVGQALDRQEERRQSNANIGEARSQVTQSTADRVSQPPQIENGAMRDSFAQRQLALDANRSVYSWVYPSFERYRQWAAAASLPGDLPPGDPRNWGGLLVPGPEAGSPGGPIEAGSAGTPR